MKDVNESMKVQILREGKEPLNIIYQTENELRFVLNNL